MVLPGRALAAVAHAEGRRQAYAAVSRSPATRRAYEGDWGRFRGWAEPLGLPTLPTSPAVVGQYIAHLADEGAKVSTIDRVLASIGFFHREGGFDWYPGHPDIARPRAGIRRTKGIAPAKKAPLTETLLIRALGSLSEVALWERAVLIVGFFGALRRSEIVAIERQHLSIAHARGADWLVVRLPRRKTDQEGKGIEVPMRERDDGACPVRAMRAWLAVCPAGPRVFPVSDRTIARLVQRVARTLGLDPESFGGHSLRAGLATTAAGEHIPMDVWMRQTGHTSVKVAMGYVRHATRFDDNVTEALARKKR